MLVIFFHFQIMYRYNMLPAVSDFHRGACSCSILWWVHLHRKQEITTYKYRYMYWLLGFRSVTGTHFVNSLWVICLDIDFIIVIVFLLFTIINRFDLWEEQSWNMFVSTGLLIYYLMMIRPATVLLYQELFNMCN